MSIHHMLKLFTFAHTKGVVEHDDAEHLGEAGADQGHAGRAETLLAEVDHPGDQDGNQRESGADLDVPVSARSETSQKMV